MYIVLCSLNKIRKKRKQDKSWIGVEIEKLLLILEYIDW